MRYYVQCAAPDGGWTDVLSSTELKDVKEYHSKQFNQAYYSRGLRVVRRDDTVIIKPITKKGGKK